MRLLFIIMLTLALNVKAQTVVCESINVNGYNAKGENNYLLKISVEILNGCGSTWGKEIFFKNNHSLKTVKGFVVKKWKYSGYENYDVCEIYNFELKPNQKSNSLGCDYISQFQPCEFRVYAKFTN
ncbi:hypothetical protein [uncultured Flavobacterium sp.]|uniref:hypothetical protein n=1 Tax=uncultured Flavobacterium sp. TaxID=165435 RepID=UPI0025D91E03|nr:hypothetical protein [uncultured Flavobacterium sp.]